MRIGIEAQRIFKPQKQGKEIATLEMIRALQVIDNTNEYFIFVRPDKDKECLIETRNFKIIEISAFNSFIWEQILLPFYAHKYALDILHCTNNSAPISLPTTLILTLHDTFLLSSNNPQKALNIKHLCNTFYSKWLVSKNLKDSEHTIAVSETIKNDIIKRFDIGEDSVSVIQGGVSRKFGIKPNPETIQTVKEKLNIKNDYFLFLGNNDPNKNAQNTIKAFLQFAEKNVNVRLVCTVLPELFLDKVLKEIGKYSLRDRFILTGFVDEASLLSLYSAAKVFLYPSFQISFGLPILEAMAFGVPVVTSDIDSIKEISGDAAFFANPSSVEEIVRMMACAYGKSSIREEKIIQGYGRPSLFSWQKNASKILEIYRKVGSKV